MSIQAISQQQLLPLPSYKLGRISPSLRNLIVAVTVVFSAVIGFLNGGLPGLVICALANAGSTFLAISILNSCFKHCLKHKPADINLEALTDLTDPEAAQGLVDFYNALPQEIRLKGPTNGQAQDIQAWMRKSSRICNQEYLGINYFEIKQLPKEICLFSNLKVLDLSCTRLQTLPAEIGSLKSLEKLELWGNELQSLPSEIGNLVSIECLDFSRNQLRVIPAEIGNLKSLKEINLSENQLQAIPAEIGNLTSLEELNLSRNQLQVIPAEIGSLKSLKELNLSENQLQAIPAEIGNLISLERLDLLSNQLQVVPVEIANLESLRNLHLSRNQLQTLPFIIDIVLGRKLLALNSLWLGFNHFRELPDKMGHLRRWRENDLGTFYVR
jgi:Leucine-rich repeat (LRR) protein